MIGHRPQYPQQPCIMAVSVHECEGERATALILGLTHRASLGFLLNQRHAVAACSECSLEGALSVKARQVSPQSPRRERQSMADAEPRRHGRVPALAATRRECLGGSGRAYRVEESIYGRPRAENMPLMSRKCTSLCQSRYWPTKEKPREKIAEKEKLVVQASISIARVPSSPPAA